ncbi:MAG TPA: DUF983 domain-containing protein [Nitrolancea sp.]
MRILGRGVLGRCPNCGQRRVFRRWFHMVDRCPNCGIFFEREEGYWTGAVAVNTIVTELVFAIVLVIGVIWTWPDIPITPMLIIALVLNGIFPIFFYPYSKTIWMALDLVLHPLEEREQHEVITLRRVRNSTDVK